MKKNLLGIGILLLAAGIAQGSGDFKEVRDLDANAVSATRMIVKCGAGSLKVTGVDGADRVRVKAVIVVEGMNKGDAEKYLQRRLELELERRGEDVVLKSHFNGKSRSLLSIAHENARVDLDVTVPRGMQLHVKDGSGEIRISGMEAGLDIRDGSGSMTIEKVAGNMDIDDGSGNILLRDTKGKLTLVDGSGSVEINSVRGDVNIRDGSGTLRIEGVTGKLQVRDGSGAIIIRNVDGDVVINDGSGDIDVAGVTRDLEIREAGSGSVKIRDVSGNVTK